MAKKRYRAVGPAAWPDTVMVFGAFRAPPCHEKGTSGVTITVYSKPACVQCTATTRALEARGLDYSVIDLTEDASALARVEALGYRQVPVVVAGDDHWAGFRPDMIGRLG